jgi:hypothetical protein
VNANVDSGFGSYMAGLGVGAVMSGVQTVAQAAVATDGDLSKADWVTAKYIEEQDVEHENDSNFKVTE